MTDARPAWPTPPVVDVERWGSMIFVREGFGGVRYWCSKDARGMRRLWVVTGTRESAWYGTDAS